MCKDNDRFWETHAEDMPKDYYDADFIDLINKMLKYNPKKRPSLDEIKNHAFLKGKTISKDDLIKEMKSRKKAF